MLAVYDLGVSPPTYDFVSFLLACECYRMDAKQTSFKVLIVPGPDNGFRHDELPPRDPKDRQAMLDNIVLPMVKLIPSCEGVEIVPRDGLLARLQGDLVFPPDYKPESPRAAYGLKFMALAAQRRVYPFFTNPMGGYGETVSITLRQTPYWATRDSDLSEWLQVAKVLKERGKRVVFVPDTSGHHGLDDYEVDEDAAKNICRRLSLYASCQINLFVNNGPAWLAAFCTQVPGIVFKMFSPGAPCVSPRFYESQGFPEGSQIGRPGFRIVYKDDTAETILEEIDRPLEPQPFAYPNVGNTTVETFLDNMRENCKRDLPWFVPNKPHSGSLVICGGGPSIKENLQAIRERKKRGQTIVALNNCWRLLAENNIMPDIVTAMDAREGNAAFFENAPKEPLYLIASTCHPKVFDSLLGNRVTVWHPDQCQPAQRGILDETAGDRPAALIGGGGTIGLRALILGYIKGYRRFHLYGMDSSYRGETHHAYEQKLNEGETVIQINTSTGKTYACARWMARQADEFQKFHKKLTSEGCVIQAHGDGLLPDLCRHRNRHRMDNLKEIA